SMKRSSGQRRFRPVVEAMRAASRFGRSKTSLSYGIGFRRAWPRKMRDVESIVEAVFREEWSRIVASLIRLSGSFDLAEEAAQEAFAQAIASWPVSGVPDNPGAWITTVARRKLIDHVRKTSRHDGDS